MQPWRWRIRVDGSGGLDPIDHEASSTTHKPLANEPSWFAQPISAALKPRREGVAFNDYVYYPISLLVFANFVARIDDSDGEDAAPLASTVNANFRMAFPVQEIEQRRDRFESKLGGGIIAIFAGTRFATVRAEE